jgi:hypothetical protein
MDFTYWAFAAKNAARIYWSVKLNRSWLQNLKEQIMVWF